MPFRDDSGRARDLDVAVDRVDADTLVLEPRGELDVATVPALDEAFRSQVNGTMPARLILDLAGVTFLDSTGMATIAEWRDRLVDGGGVFALVASDPYQRRLFVLTDLTDRLRVASTRHEALEALGHSGAVDEHSGSGA
jgi:anti-sigma B factor antagonist